VQSHIPDVKEVRGIGLSLSKLEHADLGRGGIFSYLDSFFFLIFFIPVWFGVKIPFGFQ
jgi:hypothetical protein